MLDINKLQVRKTYDVTFTLEDQEEITVPHEYVGNKQFECYWSGCYLDLNQDEMLHYDEEDNVTNVLKYSINPEN